MNMLSLQCGSGLLFRLFFTDPACRRLLPVLFSSFTKTSCPYGADVTAHPFGRASVLLDYDHKSFCIVKDFTPIIEAERSAPIMTHLGETFFCEEFVDYCETHVPFENGRPFLDLTPVYVSLIGGSLPQLPYTYGFALGFYQGSAINAPVRFISIRRKTGRKLLSSCRPMAEFVKFKDCIRENLEKYDTREEIIDNAVERAFPKSSVLHRIACENKEEITDICFAEIDHTLLEKEGYEAYYLISKSVGRLAGTAFTKDIPLPESFSRGPELGVPEDDCRTLKSAYDFIRLSMPEESFLLKLM